ncbi:MAG TPA: ABC transporter substrate-binding protein [Alphaproteobacteria bacterium]
MRAKIRLMALAAAVTLAMSATAEAKTFRWANDGDVNSMDPYARNETFLLSFLGNIYEPLARRDENLKVEPALAVSWSNPNPETWRFKLRPNVKFHDGTPFTADDVVFSIQRAQAPGSNVGTKVASVKEVRKVDDLTVDIITSAPNPILIEEITDLYIMSKAWAEKNNAVRSADLTKREENFATRNANGTGPFMLVSREPDRRTILKPNPNWWDKPKHNLTEVEFDVIANDATRVAALLSGQVDMIYTVPPQDTQRIGQTAGVRILQKPETRVVFLGFDQYRDELLKSNVKGKNPFKDVRVRKAFYQAIDMEAIKTRVMRGQSLPTALLLGTMIRGYDESVNKRHPYDPAAAKKLLAEAGYPDGFTVGMDCPNDRYVNDEAICQAVAAMLARIGVKVELNAQTRAKYFAEILGLNTSFYMLGWAPSTYDAHNVFFNLMATREGKQGQFNLGRYSNKRIDEITEAIASEVDDKKRNELISEGLRIHHEEVGHIPLHQQFVVWAVRDNVEVVQLADNYFPLRYVRVK